MGIRTADQIRQDWEINPRWQGVRRDYDAEQVASAASEARLPHDQAYRSACRLWRWLHSDWPIVLDRDPPPWKMRLSGVAKPLIGAGWSVSADADTALCARTRSCLSEGAAAAFLQGSLESDIDTLSHTARQCRFTADAVGSPLVIVAVLSEADRLSPEECQRRLTGLAGRVDAVLFEWSWPMWSDLIPRIQSIPQGLLAGCLFQSAPTGRAAVNEDLLQAGVKLIGARPMP